MSPVGWLMDPKALSLVVSEPPIGIFPEMLEDPSEITPTDRAAWLFTPTNRNPRIKHADSIIIE